MSAEAAARPAWIAPALRAISCRYFDGSRASVRGGEDWNRATGAALAERLGPALAETLSGLDLDVPPECWAALTAARVTNGARVEAQIEWLQEVQEELIRAGVRPVLLKGLATARRYPAPDARFLSDLDLLVAPGRLERLDRVLSRHGLARWIDPRSVGNRYAILYARESADGGDRETLVIDVHPAWHEVRLVDEGRRVRVGHRQMDLEQAEIGGVTCRVLPAAAELYLAVSHAVLHNPRTLSVYLDVAVCLHGAAEGVMEQVRELSRANGRERHLRHASSMAADLFGIEIQQPEVTLLRRAGVPTTVRLGYLGRGRRYLPSSALLELAWRRGVRRKLDFGRWLLGHGQRKRAPSAEGGADDRGPISRAVRGLQWLRGLVLQYERAGSAALRP